MSLFQAIQDKLDSLSPQESKLAHYILLQPRDITQKTITELATVTGSSTSTISRFCRSFQVENFSEFKLRLAMELADQPSSNQYQDITAGQPLEHILTAITANHVRSITDTARLLDIRQLRDAIAALHNAKRIHLYGSATSGIVAQDFYQKLIRLGKAAATFSDPHMQQTSAVSLTTEDVAIGFSYSGETPETIAALRTASAQGATTISVTKFGACSLAKAATIKLFISSSEAGMRRGDMASRMAQLHLIDILFVGLASEYFHVYVPRLEDSFQTVQRYTNKKRERQ